MAWTSDEAKALTDRVLSYSKSDECHVSLEATDAAHVRFAAGDVTTSGRTADVTVTITARANGKSGTLRTNETEAEGLKRAVAHAEELMAVAPPDPEWVEGLGPQSYPAIAAYHEATARADAKQRRDGIKGALDTARAKKLNVSGFFETEARWSAIANKKGLFGFQRATEASFSTTMRTDDGTGSGWAGFTSPKVSAIDPQELVARAVRKAETSAKPRDLPPGKYTVILEPQAVADLFGSLAFSMSQRAADEGRGYFSKKGGGNRIGEKIFADAVTLRSDPLDARIPGRPWSGGGGGGGGSWGLPAQRSTWIDRGVLKALAVDRYWAQKNKLAPLPLSSSLVLEGGSGTLDALVAGTARGLLVTRFWYIRVVNPQTLQVTGLTRDGVWLVEDGKVVAPVSNFRFNDGPARVMQDVQAMSAPVPAGSMLAPAIRVGDFNFSSKSDAV